MERKQRKAAVTAASAVAPERVKSGSKKRGDASPAMKRASPKRRRPPAERSSLMDPRPGDVLHRREVVEVTKGWIHYRLTGSSDLKEMPKGLWPVLAKHPPLNSD
ncbi:MAG TPA: hypothetical protein VMN36_04970 [Verrucomicrobiales bacterium]|nr:hypothetical protein [Verrucomicrobiales bacterium]